MPIQNILKDLAFLLRSKEEDQEKETLEVVLRMYRSNASNLVMALHKIKRFLLQKKADKIQNL